MISICRKKQPLFCFVFSDLFIQFKIYVPHFSSVPAIDYNVGYCAFISIEFISRLRAKTEARETTNRGVKPEQSLLKEVL